MELTWQMCAWAVVFAAPTSFALSWVTGRNLAAWTQGTLATVCILAVTLVALGLLGLDRADDLLDGIAASIVLLFGALMIKLWLRVVLEPRY